jgi:hypothetical protein
MCPAATKMAKLNFTPKSFIRIRVGMHPNGFSGPYCLTCLVRRPGASERRENE